VVLNSADERVFVPERYPPLARDDERFVLICHGTMEERYGLDTLVEAMAIVRDELPDVHVQLIGGGTYRPVRTGIFADSYVEISGADVVAGLTVAVPR